MFLVPGLIFIKYPEVFNDFRLTWSFVLDFKRYILYRYVTPSTLQNQMARSWILLYLSIYRTYGSRYWCPLCNQQRLSIKCQPINLLIPMASPEFVYTVLFLNIVISVKFNLFAVRFGRNGKPKRVLCHVDWKLLKGVSMLQSIVTLQTLLYTQK